MEGGLLVLRGAVERRVVEAFWVVIGGLVEALVASEGLVAFLGEVRVGASDLRGTFLVLASLMGDTGFVRAASIWSIASSRASMASTESSMRLGGIGERVMMLTKESSGGSRVVLSLFVSGVLAERSSTTSLKSAILTGELLIGERL